MEINVKKAIYKIRYEILAGRKESPDVFISSSDEEKITIYKDLLDSVLRANNYLSSLYEILELTDDKD